MCRSLVIPIVVALFSVMAAVSVADDAPPRGSAQSAQTRAVGELRFEEDALQVGSKRIAWDRLMTLALENPRQTLVHPDVVHLAGGERWQGRVTSFDERTLKIEVPELGEVELPVDALVAVDFQPDLAWPPARPGALERREGGPVPSKLLWIDGDELAVDSPLGVLTLPRRTARRYAFDRDEAESERPTADELVLIGGSVMRGRVTAGPEAVQVEHDLLGEVELAWSLVRTLRRRSASRVYLADLEPADRQAEPLLTDALPIDVFHRPLKLAGVLDGWVLQPRLAVSYDLPSDGGPGWLRGVIEPVPRARGTAVLRVRAGDDVVWEGKVEPDDEPQTLNVDLGTATRLSLEVDYDEPIRFPLGVHLLDPLVMIGGND